MEQQKVLERDFPVGHPKAADYVPGSVEAVEWAHKNIQPLGQRDFPVDHIKAVDTDGNTNHFEWRLGVDPAHPELESFTGAPAEVAEARRAAYAAQLPQLKETPVLEDGRVDVAQVQHHTALEFLVSVGHTEEEANAIIRDQGLDQVLAARSTLGVKG